MDFHVDLGIYNGELYGILQPDSAGWSNVAVFIKGEDDATRCDK